MSSGLQEFFRVLGEAKHILPALSYKMPDKDDIASLGLQFQESAERYADNVLLVHEGREWTYAAFNAQVNQLAHKFASLGFTRGQPVAVFMETRAEFLKVFLALAKLGVPASLINNSLTGDALLHCIKSPGNQRVIVGEERAEVLGTVRDELCADGEVPIYWLRDHGDQPCPDWAQNLTDTYRTCSPENLSVTEAILAGEVAAYIFTSGTTGLPKAAIVNHRRILSAGHGLGRLGLQLEPSDRIYLCLPLYHITGLGPGFCGAISNGASIFLRRSFSASSFWRDIQSSQSNCFVYVGELCRYLSIRPVCEEEKNNPLRKMIGNGLRPDVWDVFKDRFGVERITEIYGSSEGNLVMANVLNKPHTIGTPLTRSAVVRYDVDEDRVIRNTQGFCVKTQRGEAGLLLGRIDKKAIFDGYTNAEATKSKILTDVFKKGDRWFNTGDLVRQIDVGFAMGLKHYQFVDRTGDTFRWRAENVSTNEVAEVLNRHPQIAMANVYGVEVPGAEGRAGMVAFECGDPDSFDFEAFQQLVETHLPPYAQPVFVRIQSVLETTATFKLVKTTLRKQAFHLDQVGDDVIFLKKPHASQYVRLDRTFYEALCRGEGGF